MRAGRDRQTGRVRYLVHFSDGGNGMRHRREAAQPLKLRVLNLARARSSVAPQARSAQGRASAARRSCGGGGKSFL